MGDKSAIEWTDATFEMDFRNVGKHAAGRMLDGRTWDEFPGRT